jgi:hypothetical protein
MMQSFELAPDHRISRVIKGGWQLAGGHGAVDRQAGIEDMIAFADAGITTFDCADIYTGVEAMIGDFRAEYERVRGREALSKIKVHTKFVPDLGNLANLSRADVAKAIEISLGRLGWSGSIWCSFTGGITRSTGRLRLRAGSKSCVTKAKSPISAAPISIRTQMLRILMPACRWSPCRYSTR